MLFTFVPSISGTLIALLALGVIYFFFKNFLKPYLLLQYYKKQGAIVFFHSKLRNFPANYKAALETGDFYHRYKEALQKNPRAKFFAENIGSKVLLIPADADMMKEFLKKYDVYYKAHELYGIFTDLLVGAISLQEGTEWKRQRKMMSSAFHYEFLKNVVPMIVEVVQEQSDSWVKNGDTEHFDCVRKFGVVAGEVAGSFFFGKKFREETIWGVPMTTAGQKLVSDLGAEQYTLSRALFGPNFARKNILARHRRLNKSIEEYRAKCKEMIEEAKQSKSDQYNEYNLLNLLFQASQEAPPEERLSYENIVGKFIGLFLAGTDTPSLLMNTTLYHLSKHPEVLKRLREEVFREIKDNNSFDLDALNRLEYTTAVLKETLRMGNTGSIFFRVATKNDNLCGVHVKKGTFLNVIMPVLHYSEKYFSSPQKFIPERWLPEGKANNLKADEQGFITFSYGPRNCIGQHLGMIEAKIILSMLIKRFEFTVPPDYKMVLVQRLNLVPLEPMIIKLRERN